MDPNFYPIVAQLDPGGMTFSMDSLYELLGGTILGGAGATSVAIRLMYGKLTEFKTKIEDAERRIALLEKGMLAETHARQLAEVSVVHTMKATSERLTALAATLRGEK